MLTQAQAIRTFAAHMDRPDYDLRGISPTQLRDEDLVSLASAYPTLSDCFEGFWGTTPFQAVRVPHAREAFGEQYTAIVIPGHDGMRYFRGSLTFSQCFRLWDEGL